MALRELGYNGGMQSFRSIVDSMDVSALEDRLASSDPHLVDEAMIALMIKARNHTPAKPYDKKMDVFLKVLMDHGADIFKSYDDDTALAHFSRIGSLVSVKRLIKAGALVEPPTITSIVSRKPARHTPMMLAASQGFCEVMEYLLKNGASVETKDEDGETAVFWAARYGKLKSLQWLCEQGAKLDHVDRTGDTALHACVIGLGDGDDSYLGEVATWLVSHGLDPNSQGSTISAVSMLEDAFPDLAGSLQAMVQAKHLSGETAEAPARSSRIRL